MMRIGVIGAGEIGLLRAKSVESDRVASLAAVADPDLAAAQRAVSGTSAKAISDYRDLVSDDQIDALIVSTPVHLHEEMCIAAFEGGKHVLCEKPLSNSVESCKRILATAERTGKTLAVGFNHRFYPAMKFVKDVVEAGTIGRLDHLRVFGGHDGLANFRADWNYKSELSGGGAMMDVGIHMTDLARFVAGEVKEVFGVASNRVWNVPGSEDNAVAIMKSESGVPIIFQSTWSEWIGYQVVIEAYGDNGMVRGAYAPMFNLLVTQDKPGGPRKKIKKRYPGIIIREKLKGWQTTTLCSFETEIAEFGKMIAGECVALADGWSGLRAVEIANALYESSRTDQPLVLGSRSDAESSDKCDSAMEVASRQSK